MSGGTKSLSLIGLAEQLFNAYNNEGPNPWKTHSGAPVPPWHALGEQVQAKWVAVAREAFGEILALIP